MFTVVVNPNFFNEPWTKSLATTLVNSNMYSLYSIDVSSYSSAHRIIRESIESVFD